VCKNYSGYTVTYEVYIKKDYKPKVKWVPEHPVRVQGLKWTLILVLGLISLSLSGMKFSNSVSEPEPVINQSRFSETVSSLNPPVQLRQNNSDTDDLAKAEIARFHEKDADVAEIPRRLEPRTEQDNEPLTPVEKDSPANEPEWLTHTIKRGESLALIFSRLGLSPAVLHAIVHINDAASALKHIKPGQELKFDINDEGLQAMQYEMDLTHTLSIQKLAGRYQAEIMETQLETKIRHTHGVIHHSLFLSAKDAGLSDNLIMQLVSIYGWDIDFALDIRQGDAFTVIYEEKYKNGIKVNDGPILAAEFVNQGKAFKTVRYTSTTGRTDYYSETGHTMRKAFLRTPVNFTRISSRFNLRRKHPVLNTIRAHRGVDYAAPSGTPVKATGDGMVSFIGRKGGYGRMIVIRHGGKYSTAYAHLSRYARKLRSGSRVKQGQIIGYVGKSGLATGPHLHYEFRIHGVHHNPLTVKLPEAQSVPKEELAVFKQQVSPTLAELDLITKDASLALSGHPQQDKPDSSQVNDG